MEKNVKKNCNELNFIKFIGKMNCEIEIYIFFVFNNDRKKDFRKIFFILLIFILKKM